MALITLPYTYTPGQILTATQLNSDFQTIYNDYNGNINNANIATSAGIGLGKLQLNPGAEAFNQQTTGNITWASGLTTDTQPEIAMTSDGFLIGGPGSTTTPDVGLHRSAAGTWQMTSPSGTPAHAILDMAGGSIINATGSIIPSGTIVAYYNTSGTIPSGWLLCNGTSGTPNLIGMFIMGSDVTGGSSTPNASGYGNPGNQTGVGSITHTHTYSGTTSGPSSSNTVQNTSPTLGVASTNHTHTYSGTTATQSVNAPAAIGIVYIMKS